MEHIVELDSLRFPVFNYKRYPNCALTPTNLFALAFGLYMVSAALTEWIYWNSPTIASALCFGGICEYLIGFYTWYEGRAIQSFIDFAFGLLFMTLYYAIDLGKYSLPVAVPNLTYMQGVFYILWFVMLLALIVALMGRGFLYKIYAVLLAFGYLFYFIAHFCQREWAVKTAGYILFVAACFIFLTGLLQLINAILRRPACSDVHPYP